MREERRFSYQDDISGMLAGLELASQPNYLGHPKTIAPLIGEYFQSVIAKNEAIFAMAGPKEAMENCQAVQHRVALALSGLDPDYVALPSWNTVPELGQECIKAFALNAPYCEGENIYYHVSESMASISLTLGAMLKQGVKIALEQPGGGLHDASFHGLLQDFFEFCVSTFLGTRSMTHPDVTVADYVPANGIRWLKAMDGAGYDQAMLAKAVEMLDELLAAWSSKPPH